MEKIKVRILALVVILGLTGCEGSRQNTNSNTYSSDWVQGSGIEMNSDISAVQDKMVSTDIKNNKEISYEYKETEDLINEVDSKEVNMNTKLIRTVQLDLESSTNNTKEATDNISSKITELGGYSEKISLNQYEYITRTNIVARIPSNKVDEFLNYIAGQSLNVISKTDNLKDVTLEYYDLDSRIKVMETQRDKYMSYLEKAETIPDMMEIESRLQNVLSDLEAIKSRLNILSNKIEYSTVTINLDYRDFTTSSFGGRLKLQLINTGRNLQDSILELIDFLGYGLPQLLFVFGCIFLVLKIIALCIRKEYYKYKNKGEVKNESIFKKIIAKIKDINSKKYNNTNDKAQD